MKKLGYFILLIFTIIFLWNNYTDFYGHNYLVFVYPYIDLLFITALLVILYQEIKDMRIILPVVLIIMLSFFYLHSPTLNFYIMFILSITDLVFLIHLRKKDKDTVPYFIKLLIIIIPLFSCLFCIVFRIPVIVSGRSGIFCACQGNLKNLGTALDMYKDDHKGKYPLSLSQLKPKYLRFIPKCPINLKENTPAASYYESIHGLSPEAYKYEVSKDRTSFTMYCKGNNHKSVGIKSNYPQYNSVDGLIAK